MTAASPGVIANFLPNEYYPTEEAYLYALAEAMKHEYQAIVQAGFLLQIDCPDLAMTRVTQFADLTVDEFKDVVALHVDVLNCGAGRPAARAYAVAPVLGELRRAASLRRAAAGDFPSGAQSPSCGHFV